MNKYSVVFYDIGNCEITDYTVEANDFVAASDKAWIQYCLGKFNPEHINQISIFKLEN